MSHDLARVRLENALALFGEFVAATVKRPDAATLRGLERRFAERLQIQPSYWSQIKSRSRQIGEHLARQFERLSGKPNGWMDQPHKGLQTQAQSPGATGQTLASAALAVAAPLDDDERFIVGLVLSYYRRHPQRARTQLLGLLGEALLPAARGAVEPHAQAPSKVGGRAPEPAVAAAPPPRPPDDSLALWQGVRRGVAPLKRRR